MAQPLTFRGTVESLIRKEQVDGTVLDFRLKSGDITQRVIAPLALGTWLREGDDVEAVGVMNNDAELLAEKLTKILPPAPPKPRRSMARVLGVLALTFVTFAAVGFLLFADLSGSSRSSPKPRQEEIALCIVLGGAVLAAARKWAAPGALRLILQTVSTTMIAAAVAALVSGWVVLLCLVVLLFAPIGVVIYAVGRMFFTRTSPARP